MKKKFKKVVTRTYISKKTGKTKTYRYTYTTYKVNKKVKTRSTKNIIYRGKITKYGKEWLAKYKKTLDYSDQNELESRILSDEKNKRTVTSTTMKARMMESKTARFIYNMGGDVDELSEEMGISYEDLINDDHWNWDKETFTINGITYQFHFDYESHSLTWEVVE